MEGTARRFHRLAQVCMSSVSACMIQEVANWLFTNTSVLPCQCSAILVGGLREHSTPAVVVVATAQSFDHMVAASIRCEDFSSQPISASTFCIWQLPRFNVHVASRGVLGRGWRAMAHHRPGCEQLVAGEHRSELPRCPRQPHRAGQEEQGFRNNVQTHGWKDHREPIRLHHGHLEARRHGALRRRVAVAGGCWHRVYDESVAESDADDARAAS